MTGAAPSLSPKQVIERLRRPPTEGAPARGDHDLNPGMEPAQSLTPAAVLVPLVTHLDGLTAMFTQRTDHLLHHAGQISFPGGHMDPGDDTPEETAASRAAFAAAAKEAPQLAAYLDHHMPFYEKLRALAL